MIPTLTQELAALLGKYPNLHVDVSWVVYETYLDKDDQPSADWVKLIEAFPDRFMIGSDKSATSPITRTRSSGITISWTPCGRPLPPGCAGEPAVDPPQVACPI